MKQTESIDNKTEQCFCESYCDEYNMLRNCTCGKCDNNIQAQAPTDWQEEFDRKFTTGGTYWKPEQHWDTFGNQTQADAIKSFIQTQIDRTELKSFQEGRRYTLKDLHNVVIIEEEKIRAQERQLWSDRVKKLDRRIEELEDINYENMERRERNEK